MLSFIRAALERRRAAMLEAEALVSRFGSRGVAMARTHASDPTASDARREHYRRVARIAEHRHGRLSALDVSTRYDELERWCRRRGSMIRSGGLAVAGGSKDPRDA
jgi:hypothetical protein